LEQQGIEDVAKAAEEATEAADNLGKQRLGIDRIKRGIWHLEQFACLQWVLHTKQGVEDSKAEKRIQKLNDELQSASAENAAMADTLATLSSAGGADAIMVKLTEQTQELVKVKRVLESSQHEANEQRTGRENAEKREAQAKVDAETVLGNMQREMTAKLADAASELAGVSKELTTVREEGKNMREQLAILMDATEQDKLDALMLDTLSKALEELEGVVGPFEANAAASRLNLQLQVAHCALTQDSDFDKDRLVTLAAALEASEAQSTGLDAAQLAIRKALVVWDVPQDELWFVDQAKLQVAQQEFVMSSLEATETDGLSLVPHYHSLSQAFAIEQVLAFAQGGPIAASTQRPEVQLLQHLDKISDQRAASQAALWSATLPADLAATISKVASAMEGAPPLPTVTGDSAIQSALCRLSCLAKERHEFSCAVARYLVYQCNQERTNKRLISQDLTAARHDAQEVRAQVEKQVALGVESMRTRAEAAALMQAESQIRTLRVQVTQAKDEIKRLS